MTFDFRSVPCGDKLAVTFFPGLVERSLRHFLEEQGITGWSIVSKRDALVRFPDAKVPEDIRLCPGSPPHGDAGAVPCVVLRPRRHVRGDPEGQ